jgi:hypothetical protein
MRTTTPIGVTRPSALVLAIAVLAAALACGDITPPSAPTSSTPLAVPRSSAASGYALASGKNDSTATKQH